MNENYKEMALKCIRLGESKDVATEGEKVLIAKAQVMALLAIAESLEKLAEVTPIK